VRKIRSRCNSSPSEAARILPRGITLAKLVVSNDARPGVRSNFGLALRAHADGVALAPSGQSRRRRGSALGIAVAVQRKPPLGRSRQARARRTRPTPPPPLGVLSQFPEAAEDGQQQPFSYCQRQSPADCRGDDCGSHHAASPARPVARQGSGLGANELVLPCWFCPRPGERLWVKVTTVSPPRGRRVRGRERCLPGRRRRCGRRARAPGVRTG
jgi:hypothetical protein